MAFKGKDKGHETKKGKGKLPAQADIKKESKCFFCKKKGAHEEGLRQIQSLVSKERYILYLICLL